MGQTAVGIAVRSASMGEGCAMNGVQKFSLFSLYRAILQSYLVGIFLGVILACIVSALISFVLSGFDLHAVVIILFIPLIWVLALYHLMPGLVVAMCAAYVWHSQISPGHGHPYRLSPQAAILLWLLLTIISVATVHIFPGIFVRSSLLLNLPIAAACIGVSIFAFPKLMAKMMNKTASSPPPSVSPEIRVTGMKNW